MLDYIFYDLPLSDCAGFDSLITFEFIENKHQPNIHENLVNQTDGEHGESDDDDAATDHDDSGYYGDSDSGISSLYEAIRIHPDYNRYKESENTEDHDKNKETKELWSSEDVTQFFSLLNIDPVIWHIFTRNPSYRSDFFDITSLDICEHSIFQYAEKVRDNDKLRIRKQLIDALFKRQNDLFLIKENLHDEKQVLIKECQEVDKSLSKKADLKDILKFRRNIEKLEKIVNLVFGLEMQIHEKMEVRENDYNISMLKRRLEDASELKASHDQSFLSVSLIVGKKLGFTRQVMMEEIKRLSEINICKIRMVDQELYYCQKQISLINIFA